MIKTFSRFVNTFKLQAIELNKKDSYELLFKSGTQSIDVTHNTALISLDKPTIAVKPRAELKMENNIELLVIKNKELKAILKLKSVKITDFTSNNSILFFEVIKSHVEKRTFNKFPEMIFFALKNLTDTKSKNLIVSPASLISLFAFYIFPLPVYALCIGNMNEADIFPDDILGCIYENNYFFSVRTSNPSVKKIIEQKNVALCLVPYSKKREMYSLGKHHRNGVIDISKLDFKLTLSPSLKIPIPEFAINAIELRISEHFEFGGYTVFYAQSVKLIKYSDELPLAHTPWYNL
jgi:flavin reductase (DIM6/NTAB) family NADH-FMN oxidoreductase RutF